MRELLGEILHQKIEKKDTNDIIRETEVTFRPPKKPTCPLDYLSNQFGRNLKTLWQFNEKMDDFLENKMKTAIL